MEMRKKERSLLMGKHLEGLQSCRYWPLQEGFNVRVDGGRVTTRGGGREACLGNWSGELGAIICYKEFNKSGFDVESQGTALHTHFCPQLTLLKC